MERRAWRHCDNTPVDSPTSRNFASHCSPQKTKAFSAGSWLVSARPDSAHALLGNTHPFVVPHVIVDYAGGALLCANCTRLARLQLAVKVHGPLGVSPDRRLAGETSPGSDPARSSTARASPGKKLHSARFTRGAGRFQLGVRSVEAGASRLLRHAFCAV
jgi:hypothetical protein